MNQTPLPHIPTSTGVTVALDAPWGQVTLEVKFRLPFLTISWLSGLELTNHRTQGTHGHSYLLYTVPDSGALSPTPLPFSQNTMPTLRGFLH